MQNQYTIQNLQKYFLMTALLAFVVLFFVFLGSFTSTLLMAAIVVVAIYPLHRMLNQKVHFPAWLSALVTVLLILFLIVGPFTFFFFFLANEASSAYVAISAKINTMTQGDIVLLPKLLANSWVGQWINRISEYAPIHPEDIIRSAGELVGNISTSLLSQTTNILKSLSLVLLHTIVFILGLFYFVKDGDHLLQYFKALLPLSDDYRMEVFSKLKHLSYSIIYGLFGGAIAQGLLLGIAFAFVGIGNAAFWGTLAAFFSPIPYVGVSIIWVPAVIFLFIQKSWAAGLFLLLWCGALVSFADNFIKPFLIGSSARIHPLAILLVILGGILAFGLKGLIFGPFVLTLMMTFLHIYALEYELVLNGKNEPPK